MPSREEKRAVRHARREARASQRAQRAAIGTGITSSPDLPIPYNTFAHIQNHLSPGGNFTHHYVNGNVINSSRDDSFRISGSGNNINIAYTAKWISDSGFPFVPESHCGGTAGTGPPVSGHVLSFDRRFPIITSISQHMHQWRKMSWSKTLLPIQASKKIYLGSIAVTYTWWSSLSNQLFVSSDLGAIDSLATTSTLDFCINLRIPDLLIKSLFSLRQYYNKVTYQQSQFTIQVEKKQQISS